MGKHESVDPPFIYVHGLPNAEPPHKKYKKAGFTFAIISVCLTVILLNLFNKQNIYESFCGVEAMYNQAFFIELSSNETSYPNNTVANFMNNIMLLKPLKGHWEVALVEMSYTKSWQNLTKDYSVCLMDGDRFFLHVSPGRAEDELVKHETAVGGCGSVRGGYYDNVMDLCKEIEKSIGRASDIGIKSTPKFGFDNISKKVSIYPGETESSSYLLPYLSEEIKGILGFDSYDYSRPRAVYWGDRPADISAGINTLFVMCDIIEPQYIGDTRAKLLRTIHVPANSKFGDQVIMTFDNPHYVPLLTNDFEHIEIDIRDDTNTRIPFMYGRSRVKLHLRQKDD